MTVRPVERTQPAQDSDEITTLAGVLDFLRATVVNKVAGLSDEDARRASAEPSTLTPASVVKHLSAVERWWFSIDFADAAESSPKREGSNSSATSVRRMLSIGDLASESGPHRHQRHDRL